MLVSVSVSVGVGVAERLSSFGSQSDSCPRRLRFGGCEFRDEEKRHTTTRTRARASVSLVLFLRRNGMHLVCGVNSWQLGALLQAASLWSVHWAHVFSFNRRYECSVSLAAFHLFPCLYYVWVSLYFMSAALFDRDWQHCSTCFGPKTSWDWDLGIVDMLIVISSSYRKTKTTNVDVMGALEEKSEKN